MEIHAYPLTGKDLCNGLVVGFQGSNPCGDLSRLNHHRIVDGSRTRSHGAAHHRTQPNDALDTIDPEPKVVAGITIR